MIYWGGIAYIAISLGLLTINAWLGGIWLALSGVAFYGLVVWDERNRRKRGQTNPRNQI